MNVRIDARPNRLKDRWIQAKRAIKTRDPVQRWWHLRLRWVRQTRRDRAALNRARREWAPAYAGLDDPLVSITVPTYNRGKLFVERTLPALLAQTYPNIEIVVVGDHATAETTSVMEGLDDPRIRWHNLPVRPAYPDDEVHFWMVAGCEAINQAMAMARGYYIAHCDDDDLWTENHLEVLLSRFVEAPYLEFVTGQTLTEITEGAWRADPGPFNNCWSAGPAPLGIAHSAVLFRTYLRVFRLNANSWRWNTPVDRDTWNRMIRAGVRMGLARQIVTFRPLRPGQVVLVDRGSIRTHGLQFALEDEGKL